MEQTQAADSVQTFERPLSGRVAGPLCHWTESSDGIRHAVHCHRATLEAASRGMGVPPLSNDSMPSGRPSPKTLMGQRPMPRKARHACNSLAKCSRKETCAAYVVAGETPALPARIHASSTASRKCTTALLLSLDSVQWHNGPATLPLNVTVECPHVVCCFLPSAFRLLPSVLPPPRPCISLHFFGATRPGG